MPDVRFAPTHLSRRGVQTAAKHSLLVARTVWPSLYGESAAQRLGLIRTDVAVAQAQASFVPSLAALQ
jgi:hypothetical protein